MAIIQSFALFDEGNPYMSEKGITDKKYTYLNFYSFLLSFATLKHFYGKVMIYCNQKAYDTFLKYIPYDVLRIRENKNPIEFWNCYKLDCIREFNDEVIHVDTDVVLFKNVFDDFILNEDVDILVQDVLSKEKNMASSFGYDNKEFLKHNKIFTKEYDGRGFSCGVLGLKKGVFEKYFEAIDILYKELIQFKKDKGLPLFGQTMIIEEILLYLVAKENDFKYTEILPYDLILKHGVEDVGDMVGYGHFWKLSKYDPENIKKFRNAIQLNYPEQYWAILEYEEKVLKPLNISI